MGEEWAELSPSAQAARAVFLSHPGGNRLGNAEGWEASTEVALKAATCPHGDLAAGRDELRKLLDEIGVIAANAPEDGDSFGLLEETAMRIAAAGVPDSTPLDEWPDPGNPVTGRTPGAAAESARDALDAQSLHDSPGGDM